MGKHYSVKNYDKLSDKEGKRQPKVSREKRNERRIEQEEFDLYAKFAYQEEKSQ